MNLVQIVRSVEDLFDSLDSDITNLQNQTGIHCIENCIHCCTSSKIEATSVEFLPLAYHLYKKGMIRSVLDRMDQLSNEWTCPVLNVLSIDNSQPGCSYYPYRGLICRLFSYNYVTNKHGIRQINACKNIRINQPLQLAKVNELLLTEPVCPKASDYYSRLLFIHFEEAHNLYPIAKAITVAIEMVLTHLRYKGKKVM
nr:hypothetical protein [uncultured Carboxylicivirga sp.]